jgi:simple sugar transport system ATP-binding protein
MLKARRQHQKNKKLLDVAAKQEIMERVLALCSEGLAIVFISAELEEVLHTSHRIVVLRDRRKVAELPAETLDEAGLLRIIAGHDTVGAATEERAT